MKLFVEEFRKIKNLLQSKIPFSFSRFSDGELFILKNLELQLDASGYTIGDSKGNMVYTEEERKHFDPLKHQWFRELLLDSFRHKQLNYFKGICSRTDVGAVDFNLQLSLANAKEEDSDLTFANLFINSNYPLFMNELLPLLKLRNVAMVCNKKCSFDKLPFKVSKAFYIGSNCMINNISVVDDAKKFLSDKTDWVVLCSAASLSNIIAYECFKSNPSNTIIDIGSSLNPLLGLSGWVFSRDYLKHYWLNMPSQYCLREEKW